MDASVDVSVIIRKRPSGAMSQLIGPVRIPSIDDVGLEQRVRVAGPEYGVGGDVDSHHLGIG